MMYYARIFIARPMSTFIRGDVNLKGLYGS